ncbi:MAG: hypothetical protein A2Z29_06790 [Chloroflexi bacterium RBG_16_56_11]|nr:MAG: hypothetical protein A2Z29_06790 [Chloroflexi bacterium RBG_16_56_11]
MYVGLTIGNSEIKVLSVAGRQIKKWGKIALSEGQVRDGLILQPQAVGEAISGLFKSVKLPRDKVVTSLAGLSFTYRFLNLPRMKPLELEEAILRAARKEISLPLDDLYLTWQAMPGKSAELTIFFLGVPKNMVDVMVETLHVAGIPPYLMDLRPLALARAAYRENAIVVNLEPDCFDIVFIANGVPAVIHTINPRSEEATLEDNIRRLADELTKTAAFYHGSHPQAPLSPATPLLLAGDLSAEFPAGEMLQDEIEYPVKPLLPPAEYPDVFPVASYGASAGLALKKVPLRPAEGEKGPYHDINVNILDGKYRKPRGRPVSAGLLFFSIILVIAIVLLFPLYQTRADITAKNTVLQNELMEIKHQIDIAIAIGQESSNTEEAVRKLIASAESVKTTNQDILSPRGMFSTDLQRVTGNLPAGAYFTSIDISNDLISAQGEADNVFTVVAYATALEKEPFSEVRITTLGEVVTPPSAAGGPEEPSAGSTAITFSIIILK